MHSIHKSRAIWVLILALLFVSGGFMTRTNKADATQQATITGVLNVQFGDPLPGTQGRARMAYSLTESTGKSWSLSVPPGLARAATALDRRGAQVSGNAVGSRRLNVASLSASAAAGASPAPALALSGSQAWATLLCRFAGDASEDQPLSFFDDLMGMTKPGANHYWRELSYEEINLDGSAQFNWVSLPNNRAFYIDDTDPDNQGSNLGALAEDCADAHDAGVNFSLYDGINFIFNDTLDCCAWGGSTTISTGEGILGFPATWMPPGAWGTTSHGVLAQEMGHAFGLKHEGCQGTESPYDSNWDPMSSAGNSQIHTNVAYKDVLSWIPGARRYDATNANNQVVNLERLALPNPAGYLMVKIPLPGGKYYTLESRKFVGYDGSPDSPPDEAVVIHIVDMSLSDKRAQVVVGDGPCNGDGGAWLPGELYKDAANNISVAIVSEFTSGFTVAINPTADLKITKTATPNPAVAGQQLTYNINVTNQGGGPAVGVIVTDDLPDAVTFVSSTVPCVPIPGGDINDYTCSLGSILAGDSKSFQIVVDVPPNIVPAAGATTITNDVSVATDTDDTDLSNNSFSLTTTVVDRADLKLAKECKPDQPNKQPAGVPTFCEIYVDNLGPSDARNVVITDRIIAGPAPVTITAILSTTTSGPAAVCVPATPIGPTAGATITCTDTVLPVGARDTIKVTFVADDTTDVDDNASVTSDTPDPNNSNNAAVGKVSFGASANLSLAKAAPVTAIAGMTFSYSFTVTNLGPSTAENVVLKDTLPAGVEVQSVTPGLGNTCQPTYTPLTCNLGNMADGDVEVVSVLVKVKASVPKGTILLNNANVTTSSADPNTGNNSATASTTVDTSADLVMTKTADAAEYKPNSTLIYKLRVVNNGPSDAQNVVVVDTLPEQKQAIYESNTGGCVFQAPKTLTCNIGTMVSGEIKEFFVYVKVKGAQGDVTNSAAVSSTTSDPVAINNTSSVTVQVKGGGQP